MTCLNTGMVKAYPMVSMNTEGAPWERASKPESTKNKPKYTAIWNLYRGLHLN